jgi:chromosome segregation ATPase
VHEVDNADVRTKHCYALTMRNTSAAATTDYHCGVSTLLHVTRPLQMNTLVDAATRMQPDLNSAQASLQSERAKTQQYAADLAEANRKCNGFVTATAALKQRSAELDRNCEAAQAAVRRLTAERDEVIEAEIAREAANAVSASTRDVVGKTSLILVA